MTHRDRLRATHHLRFLHHHRLADVPSPRMAEASAGGGEEVFGGVVAVILQKETPREFRKPQRKPLELISAVFSSLAVITSGFPRARHAAGKAGEHVEEVSGLDSDSFASRERLRERKVIVQPRGLVSGQHLGQVAGELGSEFLHAGCLLFVGQRVVGRKGFVHFADGDLIGQDGDTDVA